MVVNPFDPRQQRDARGRWTTSGAIVASREANARSKEALAKRTPRAHEDAAEAHEKASKGTGELAVRHAKLGNTRASAAFAREEHRHGLTAQGHREEVLRLTGTPRVPRRTESHRHAVAARRGWEKKHERNECVASNLPPHLLPLWDKMKSAPGFRTGTCDEVTRKFFDYVESHPREAQRMWIDEADARLEKEIREYETARNTEDLELEAELAAERDAMKDNPRPKEERDDGGRYAVDLDHPCTCGHKKGDHAAGAKGRSAGDCTAGTWDGDNDPCGCEKFKPSKKKAVPPSLEEKKENPMKKARAVAVNPSLSPDTYARTYVSELVSQAATELAAIAKELRDGALPKLVRGRIDAQITVLQAVSLGIKGTPTAALARANPSPPSYKAAHWGLDPTKTAKLSVPVPRDNRELLGLGELVSVVYLTVKGGDRAPTEYEHKFERRRPVLAYGDKDGRLFVAGGGYRVSSRGIVG